MAVGGAVQLALWWPCFRLVAKGCGPPSSDGNDGVGNFFFLPSISPDFLLWSLYFPLISSLYVRL